jgi:hypothetical protein
LDNQLSSLEVKQNNMAHLNQCSLLNAKKVQQCHIQELNPSFVFHLHQSIVTNEHEYVTKMAQNATMGDLWETFIAMF